VFLGVVAFEVEFKMAPALRIWRVSKQYDGFVIGLPCLGMGSTVLGMGSTVLGVCRNVIVNTTVGMVFRQRQFSICVINDK